jgi:hypothetical protein
MLWKDWPDEIPTEYREKYGWERLLDSKVPTVVPENVRQEARSFAEKSVESVKQLIFPTHRAG